MTIDSFIPELWSKKYLMQLYKAQVYTNCVNKDYEGEIKNFGDTVRVNTIGPITIGDYTKNTVNLTPQVLAGSTQTMQIDQQKYFYFEIDDVDKAQVIGSVMDNAMSQAAYNMKDVTDVFLATTMAAAAGAAGNTLLSGSTVSSTTNPLLVGTGSGVNDAFETLVDLTTLMNTNNVPPGDRFVVLPPDYVGLMLKDARFTSFATASAVATIKEGSSGGGENGALPGIFKMLTGMDVYVSNNVPSSSGIKTIIAGSKSATSWAEQISGDGVEAFRLQTGFADAVRALHLFGAKVFRPDALAIAYVQVV